MKMLSPHMGKTQRQLYQRKKSFREKCNKNVFDIIVLQADSTAVACRVPNQKRRD